jgi:hypothetical protein
MLRFVCFAILSYAMTWTCWRTSESARTGEIGIARLPRRGIEWMREHYRQRWQVPGGSKIEPPGSRRRL